MMVIEWFDSPLNAAYTRESGLTDTGIWFEWGQYPKPISGGGESIVFQVHVDDTVVDTRLFGAEAVNRLKELGILTPERISRITRQYHGAAEVFGVPECDIPHVRATDMPEHTPVIAGAPGTPDAMAQVRELIDFEGDE